MGAVPHGAARRRLHLLNFGHLAHGEAHRRLHLLHLGHRGPRGSASAFTPCTPWTPRGPCGGGWPYAGTSAVRLLGDQSAATQVACAGPREALQNTPYSEQNFPTSLFLPLSRPAFRRTPLRQTGGGHARMVLRRGLQIRNGATARAGASRMSLMRTSRPDSRTQISWLCAGSPAATARGD